MRGSGREGRLGIYKNYACKIVYYLMLSRSNIVVMMLLILNTAPFARQNFTSNKHLNGVRCLQYCNIRLDVYLRRYGHACTLIR